MTTARREQLLQRLSDELRGLEDDSIARIRGVFTEALAETITRVSGILRRIEDQPFYDEATTPGAFLGSTPDGPVAIEPVQKNQARLALEGQLLIDLQVVLAEMNLSPTQMDRLETALRELYSQAQALGDEYAIQLVGSELQPALAAAQRLPLEGEPPAPEAGGWPRATYQEGQTFTRLFDLAGSVAAAERDFESLAANYERERDEATEEHVRISKAYYARWWRDWGDQVRFVTAREMAAGPDPRRTARELIKRIPNINEAFHRRNETIARTETLMASGEAMERSYRRLRVGFVQFLATRDDRTCEFCAPRLGCLYWIGTVKTPLHPQCRCGLTPVTLESLVLQNAFATKPEEGWEAEAQGMAARVEEHYRSANGERPMRPIGGTGQQRGPADYPLMERTGLPQTIPRASLSAADPLVQASRPWPSGDPVWCPRRGWLDDQARRAYQAIAREVEAMGPI